MPDILFLAGLLEGDVEKVKAANPSLFSEYQSPGARAEKHAGACFNDH